MLNVECESCKAPYQVDERRVPPAGLKMRCPKCGHSFLVTTGGGAPLASLSESDLPVVSAGLPAAKRSTPSPPTLAPRRPGPPPLPTVKTKAPETSNDDDLPELAPDLPSLRPSPPKTPPVPVRSTLDFDMDLPSPAADLPAARREYDVAGLPVVAAALPANAASLPMNAASLPVVASRSSSSAPSLPRATNAGAPPAAPSAGPRGFGEIDLPPALGGPPPLPAAQGTSARADAAHSLEGFGEIDLPREAPVIFPIAPVAPALPIAEAPKQADKSSPDLDILQLDKSRPAAPRSGSSFKAMAAPPAVSHPAGAGMSFGEVDFGGIDLGGEASIGVDEPPPPPPPPAAPTAPTAPTTPASVAAAVEAPLSLGALQAQQPVARPRRKRSIRLLVVAGIVGVAVIGGAALQLTPYGVFGTLYLSDRFHAKDYALATASAVQETQRTTTLDTYDAAKSAVAATKDAHARRPRARSLTAYAAFVDFATTVRFGPDTARPLRGRQLLAELPPSETPKYLDLARAAQLAANEDFEKADKALDAAASAYASDPVAAEMWLLRGNIQYAEKDAAAAVHSFRRALDSMNDARGHYGLARAYDFLRDVANTKKEIEATLAASPQHAGALVLRARSNSLPVDQVAALRDLQTVLTDPVRTKAAPADLSNAYSAKAWVSLERGGASDARQAFAEAVKINPRNVDALSGQGRLLLNEGRYTEALTRFDTALQADPASPEAIASDAEAKLALDRLGDAKRQLVAALQRFPKSIPILLVLGRVEQRLADNSSAESSLRAAIALVDPAARDAELPYVALSELLSSRGLLNEAKGVLDEAKGKLPASAPLDRAFGEVAELRGDYDHAIADYKSSVARAPLDIVAHFRLAVALRRIRKYDEAVAEFDRVAALDNDYPGLSLERGLLFEESGDVEKAIAEFKSALDKAPGDPDLQLRVGSAYVMIGRPDDALPVLRKVIASRPASAEALHYLGRALMLKSRLEQPDALRYLKRAVDLDPNRAEFHVYLAWAANEATPAQLELARDEIDKAMSLDKMNADVYWQKGVLERMEGAIEDAIKDARRSLELRPSRYEAHATLAECYEDKNDTATAMAEWARAFPGASGAARDDGTVLHPYWHYKYGKLLFEYGNVAVALTHLLPAAITTEKNDPRSAWLAPLEFLTAEALRKTGHGNDATDHYRRFLEIAPLSSPDRADAQAALARLSPASR